MMVAWRFPLCFSRKIGRDDDSVPDCKPRHLQRRLYNDVAPSIIIRPMCLREPPEGVVKDWRVTATTCIYLIR